jgi:DNA-binding transcriptional LysR family regulator
MDYEPIYVTYDELHADRIRGILAAEGIDCAVRSMRVGGYEGIRVGPLGEIRILVPPPYAGKARRLIQEAIRDGALWPLGAPWDSRPLSA